MKFTFKTTKPTGRWASFEPSHHAIKLNKIEVGCIKDDPPWTIRIQVMKKDIMEDGNPNCEWRWVTFNKDSQTLQEAKDWLNANIDVILEKYKLYLKD